MKRHLLKSLSLVATATIIGLPASAFTPVSPGDLNAETRGIAVALTWEWGNAGPALLTESFETGSISDPWCTINHYNYEPEGGNWAITDFSSYPDDPNLAYDGTHSALIMPAQGGDDENPSTFHQDEWLTVRPGTGAVYMDFWYWLYYEVLDWGGYQDFPDHYYVKISRDNGNTWTELWDGRWDMGSSEDVQQASLFIGEATDENTIIAFNAVSGNEESLYSAWSIDDVSFYGVSDQDKREVTLRSNSINNKRHSTISPLMYRKFTPGKQPGKANRIVQEPDWINNGNTTYRVYLDDIMIADFLKARHFVDLTTKSPGKHTYKVLAWSESEDVEYDAASIDVTIEDYSFDAPVELQAEYSMDKSGKYTVSATWGSPSGKLTPTYYNVYINDKQVGRVDINDEPSLGQSGLYKGAYKFTVEACYTYPDGVSEPVSAYVYPGIVPTPENLEATLTENTVELKWDSPSGADPAPVSYNVYWNDQLVAEEHTETAIVLDNDYPGTYFYSVHAVYPDGTESIPACLRVETGDMEPFDLWEYPQDFFDSHTPLMWDKVIFDPYNTVKEMYAWRFDNWFEIEIPNNLGFDNGFASVSGKAAGMNKLQTCLIAPPLLADETAEFVEISFDKYYSDPKPGPSGAAQFALQISLDFGEWNDVADLASAPNGKCVYHVGDVAGHVVQLRWAFLSRNSGEAAIDNVTILHSDLAGVTEPEITDESAADVYSLSGILIKEGASADEINTLPSGLYIIRDKKGGSVRAVR